jgi:hypothetical protein
VRVDAGGDAWRLVQDRVKDRFDVEVGVVVAEVDAPPVGGGVDERVGEPVGAAHALAHRRGGHGARGGGILVG